MQENNNNQVLLNNRLQDLNNLHKGKLIINSNAEF